MPDGSYYGCCACIGAAGIGLVPKMQLLTTKCGFALNLFINGSVCSKTPRNNDVRFDVETDYPKSGAVKVTVHTQDPERFELRIRNPYWSKETVVLVNQTATKAVQGYINVEREWTDGDVVDIELDMSTQAIKPIPYGAEILMNRPIWGANYVIQTFDKEDPLAKKHIALRRGPVMLAQDNRLWHSVDEPIRVKVSDGGLVDVCSTETSAYPNIIAVKVPLENGTYMTVTDYASAGKLWTEESKMAVWMRNE